MMPQRYMHPVYIQILKYGSETQANPIRGYDIRIIYWSCQTGTAGPRHQAVPTANTNGVITTAMRNERRSQPMMIEAVYKPFNLSIQVLYTPIPHEPLLVHR